MSARAPLDLETLITRAEISDVVLRYATGIDRRDWPLFRSCFADQVELDFTSWSGGEVRSSNADEWVAGVAAGLSGFDATQHISSNHVHEIDGDRATCVSYMIAHHHAVEAGERLMHKIGGYYTNQLRKGADGWRIHACKLTVTWEMGDRARLFGISQQRWQARNPAPAK
jgi:SnoaL-like protein